MRESADVGSEGAAKPEEMQDSDTKDKKATPELLLSSSLSPELVLPSEVFGETQYLNFIFSSRASHLRRSEMHSCMH